VLAFLRDEKQFLYLILFWIGLGMFFAPLTYVVVPVVLLLLQRRKMYLEMLVGFFVILIFSDSRQYSFHFAQDIKDIYLVLLAVFMFSDWKAFRPGQRVFFRFLPFIITAVLFLILSDIPLQSAQKTLSYALLLLVVPNYLVYACKTDARHALRMLIWTGVLVLVTGLILRSLQPDFVTLAGRYSGMLGNPNGLGLFCIVFFILVAVSRNVLPDLFTKRETYLINGIIILSIIFSGSRNAVFTIGIFMMFHYFYKISPFIGILMFLVAIVVYQLLLANLASIIYSLDLQEYFRVETLENASGRIIAWNFGWEKISENPLIGHGIGHTDHLYRINYGFLSVLGHQGNAHNSYITFWLDTGLFGMLFYIVAFAQSFIMGARRYSAAIPAMFAILFSAFFESWLTASLNPFTIQCVIIMTLISSPVFSAAAVEQKLPEAEENETAEDEQLNRIPGYE
jgi:O-antigen ligase